MSESSESEHANRITNGKIPDLVMTGRRISANKNVKMNMGTSEENECIELSPPVSRYGRAHKPKKSEDFLPTDKKVGALFGLSPKKSSTPSPNITPKKLKEKEKTPNESSKEKEKKKRGRHKLKLHNSSKSEEKSPTNHTALSSTLFSEDKQDLDVSNNSNNLQETSEVSQKLTPNAKTQEDMDATVRLSPDTTTPAEDIQKKDITPKSLLEESFSIGESVSDCGWKPGDLAWARIGGHPFWPCMIAIDLQTGLFTKTKRAGRGMIVHRSLHVQFYGDNGRHCWISSNCVIRFEGKKGLDVFAEKVLSEMKKKDKKYSSAFVIRPSAKSAWDCAVREAEDALPQSREERIRYFLETFPPEMRREDKNEIASESTGADRLVRLTRKRKHSSSDSDDRPLKLIKIEPDSTLEIKKKSEPVRVNSPNKKKIKKVPNKKKKKKDGGFSVYADKFSQRVSEDHPEMNAQEVRSILAKLWSELDETEKSKYENKSQITDKNGAEETSAEEDEADEDVEDTNDNLSNSTRESSPNLFAPFLKKGGSGIFRGTRIEKVCQLCLKPGNTVKCKGPCLGIFHVACIKNPPQIKIEAVENEIKAKKKRLSKGAKNGNDKLKIKMEPEDATDVEKSSESEETCDGEKEQTSNDDGKQSQIEDESSESNDSGEFRCKDCSENRPPSCFVCGLECNPKVNDSSRVRCSGGHCGKFYHMECLRAWPQTSCTISRRQSMNTNKGTAGKDGANGQLVTCPQHVCHTCASDDPRNATMRFNHERLVRCVLCPTAYHTGNYCVPAGSEILTGCQIICPKHYVPPPKACHHVNASWCFICAVGGSLICCDLCPTSFHAECLRITPPEEGYICEDCDTGRFPLYGEVVWVKLGTYRWWPAQILFPNQIPDKIENIPHNRGEFAVKFFGSHDYYWVNRGRVFLYQEGDTGHRSTKKSSVDGVFQTALGEALEAFKKMQVERSQKEAEARPGMKPPTYVRIKSNKPVGNVRVNDPDPASMTPCDCDAEAENPCGFGSDCINRILMVECNPTVCRAGDRCANQCFTKRQYPPLVPFRTESRGWGLKALKELRRGQFVIEYVGEMIDEEEYKNRLECKHKEKDENYYFLTIDKDRMLDAGPKGNVARFMNHSCQPNCETQKWNVNGDTRVGLFALQAIPEGEELTFNYNLECVGTEKKPCMCGAPNCSGYIGMKVSKIVEDDKKVKGKQELLKRRRKRQNAKSTEAVCFKCGDGGDLLLCDYKTCPKGYHLGCARRRTWPQGKWVCPWHYCNVCKKRTNLRCGFCPNAFCPQHSDGNIRLNSELGSVCQDHDVVSEDTVSSSVNESTLKGGDKTSVENTTGDSSKSDSVSSSVKLSVTKKENNDSEPKKEDKLKTKIKIEAKEPAPSTSGLQKTNSDTPDKKKRGRPRKYPVGTTPKMRLQIIQESMSPVKNGLMVNPAAIVNDVSVPKKRGRPRKSLPNPLAVNSQPITKPLAANPQPITKPLAANPQPISDTPVPPKFPPASKSSKPDTPNTIKEIVNENKKKIKVEPEDRLIETPKNSSIFMPRTSSRKRQPSEKITAYLNSLPKAKKSKSLSVKVKEEPKSAPVGSLSPSFYSMHKKTPKKTILQRIDHKPDVSKVLSFASSMSPACKSPLKSSKIETTIKTPLMRRVSTLSQERMEVRNINSNVNEMVYRKNQISGILNDNVHTNGILESLNESDSQYFDSSVTTIPLKCPEFVPTRNEFLVKESENEMHDTGVENHLMHTGDSTEKLTEDGKYQILTNVCPETLASIDNASSLLLHVES